MTPDFARSHSSPFEPFSADERRAWAGFVQAQRIEGFVARWKGLLDAQAQGTRTTLEALAAELSSSGAAPLRGDAVDAAWHPFAALVAPGSGGLRNEAEALALAAQAMLRIAAFLPIEVAFPSCSAGTFVFDRFSFSGTGPLTIVSSGDECLVARHDQDAIGFARSGEGWRQSAGPPLKTCPAIRLEGIELLVCPIRRSFASSEQSIRADEAGLEALRQALGLIASVPAYARWVTRTLRVISPLKTRPSCYDSESFAQLPATMFASLHPDAIRTAETIVHEVSHDHLHLMMALDPLVEPGTEEQFYSPPKRSMRPALGVLKAHHAFANVLCFYYLLRASGVPLKSCYGRSIAELEDWHRHFVDCLERAQSLTPVGEALWWPVAMRVGQLAAIAGLIAA